MGGGRGKATVASLSAQLAELQDRVTAQEAHLASGSLLGADLLDGEPLDVREDFEPSLRARPGQGAGLDLFGSVQQQPASSQLLSFAGLPPSRGMGTTSPIGTKEIRRASFEDRTLGSRATPAEQFIGTPEKLLGAHPILRKPQPVAEPPGDLRSAVAALVNAQAAFLDAQTRTKEQPSDPLTMLMGGDGGFGDGLKLPGARGAAAMEMLRVDFESRPRAWTATVRAMAQRALAEDPMCDLQGVSMTEYAIKHFPWGVSNRQVTHLGYGTTARGRRPSWP